MAYNNGFPVGYQPMYYPQGYPQNPQPNTMNQPQQQAQPQAPMQTQNSIIWVQGEAGAKSFLVAPNTTVQLWDSEEQTIYLKSADASGMPSMKILDYKIRENGSGNNAPLASLNGANSNDYITREEFHAFEEKIAKRLDSVSEKRTKKEVNNE